MVADHRFKRFFPLTITLLLALFLFFLVKDFLQTVILVPLLYVIWFVILIIESLPQGVIWMSLLLVSAYIAFRSLKQDTTERFQTGQLLYRNSGQVEKWARFLDQTQTKRYTKWHLAKKLKQLSQKLLSPPDVNSKRQYQDDLKLPEEISAFFEARQPTIKPFWKKPGEDKDVENERALDLDPEVVIQYLEKRMRL